MQYIGKLNGFIHTKLSTKTELCTQAIVLENYKLIKLGKGVFQKKSHTTVLFTEIATVNIQNKI